MANEKRLIDANAFVEKLQTDFKRVFTNAGKKVKPEDYYIERKTVFNEDFYKAEVDDICLMVNCFPTVDAVEVVHGRWIINSDGYYPYCSECKEEPKHGEMTHYCPNCGAKMDGDGNG